VGGGVLRFGWETRGRNESAGKSKEEKRTEGGAEDGAALSTHSGWSRWGEGLKKASGRLSRKTKVVVKGLRTGGART